MTRERGAGRCPRQRAWPSRDESALLVIGVLFLSHISGPCITSLALSYIGIGRSFMPSRGHARITLQRAFIHDNAARDLDASAGVGETTPETKRTEIQSRSHDCLPYSMYDDGHSILSPRRIIVMGGPASGKGTQCEWIAKKYGLVHLSTGDMLRDAVARDSSRPGSIGAIAKECMDSGRLVPDEVIIRVLEERIMRPDCRKHGYLLDGFPRTRAQALALKKMGISPGVLLYITVPDEVLIDRVVGRRLDPVTGKTYHLEFNQPPEDVRARLITRSDDTVDKIKERLVHFHENASPVRECFAGILMEIDGSGTPKAVADQIEAALNRWPLQMVAVGRMV